MENVEHSLEKRVVNASTWVLLAYGTGQIIRFGSHLILARLLLPEDFGLVQLLFTFIYGLTLFSDLGVSQNIMQHDDGENIQFLQTAWTIQIFRGVLIWFFTLLISYPLMVIYKEPKILWLLPLAGVSSIFEGFISTNVWRLHRTMEIKKFNTLEVFSQCIGTVFMLYCAWNWRSVWALVVAPIVTSFVKTVLSHISFKGPRMKLLLSRRSSREIFHFGKWIFLSGITGFLGSRLDIIIMGIFLTKRELGYFSIATAAVMLIFNSLINICGSILIPYYAKMKQENLNVLRKKIFWIRLSLILLVLLPLYIVSFWGQEIVNIIYPPDFHGVGWMLQILAIGGAFRAIRETIQPMLIANGDTYSLVMINLLHCAILVATMLIGGTYWGTKGLLMGIVASQLLVYPMVILITKKYGLWLPYLDLTLLSTSLVMLAII